MYSGKITPELSKLYEQYRSVHGHDPDGYVEIEYGTDYSEFIKDIKKALEKGVSLPALYPVEDNDEEIAPISDIAKLMHEEYNKEMKKRRSRR